MTERMLSEVDFRTMVKLAPLVSLDLIVRDSEGNVLLGLRNNRPAQGYLFVPGGSVRKCEDFYGEALARIGWKELGMNLRREDVRPLGLFRHTYEDNFSGTDFGTDYFACGFELVQAIQDKSSIQERGSVLQHREWVWMNQPDLLIDARVHPNTKAYFEKNPPNRLF